MLSLATARPWRLANNESEVPIGPEIMATYTDRDTPQELVIARVYGYKGIGARDGSNHKELRLHRWAEMYANAKLVVRAVNTYEALRELQEIAISISLCATTELHGGPVRIIPDHMWNHLRAKLDQLNEHDKSDT